VLRALAPRLLGAVLTLFLAVTLAFALARMAGDPVRMVVGEMASDDEVRAMRQRLGLSGSLATQYVTFMGGLLRGDLGESIRYARPNSRLVLGRLPATIQLAVAALALAILVGIPLGLVAGLREGGWLDRVAFVLAVIAQSMPLFWVGLVLMLVFAVRLDWVPAAGAGTWRHLVLPATTLALYPLARVAILTRASLLDVLAEMYITAARARGLRPLRILIVHALRNAALPVVTLIGLQMGAMLSGAITVEFVFAWPGIGQLVTAAVLARDVTLVQATVIVGAATFVIVNLAVDLVYGVIDPRIRDAAP
jgi:peptide/nickel transport system permease protein